LKDKKQCENQGADIYKKKYLYHIMGYKKSLTMKVKKNSDKASRKLKLKKKRNMIPKNKRKLCVKKSCRRLQRKKEDIKQKKKSKKRNKGSNKGSIKGSKKRAGYRVQLPDLNIQQNEEVTPEVDPIEEEIVALDQVYLQEGVQNNIFSNTSTDELIEIINNNETTLEDLRYIIYAKNTLQIIDEHTLDFGFEGDMAVVDTTKAGYMALKKYNQRTQDRIRQYLQFEGNAESIITEGGACRLSHPIEDVKYKNDDNTPFQGNEYLEQFNISDL